MIASTPRQWLIALLIAQIPVLSASEGLSVFTSENPKSNEAKSFIVVPAKKEIPEGITNASTRSTLVKQLPFRIEILEPVGPDDLVQWSIRIPFNHFGRIWVLSDYSGKKKVNEIDTIWTSFKLDNSFTDRHIISFEPRPKKHLSHVYKKGKPTIIGGTSYGGGTEDIGIAGRNPRLSYEVTGRVFDKNGKQKAIYETLLQMDNKDMVRQEYINHYSIGRATAGAAGNLPVPRRKEFGNIPSRPAGFDGNTMTESHYKIIIEDGAVELAGRIQNAYKDMRQFYQKPGKQLKDLNGQPLDIPESRLWLSSGWRNPERNEWYSDALNGAHQLGAALDIMPNEVPRQKNAAIIYWVLWDTISSLPDQHLIFAQLEALTVPVRHSAFKVDIEPRNGIPDAFDKADHLHIHVRQP